MAKQSKTFKDNDLKNQIFKELGTSFCVESAATAEGFVVKYFAMQALIEYFKGCTLLHTETELCCKLIEGICAVTLSHVVPFCSAETIDSAITMLRVLVEADHVLTKQLSNQILPHILVVFEQYHKDAMLAEDILGLISAIAQVPQNESFTVIVVP